MTLLAAHPSIAKAFSAQLMPARRPRSMLEFAHTMKLPDGPKEGHQFRPETEPTQMHFIRAMDSGEWRRFVYIAPSQRGKTTVAILLPWLYSMVEEGYGFGYVLPVLLKLQQMWMSKLQPGIRGSGFGAWLPQQGPGSRDGMPPALAMQNPDNGKNIITYFMAAGTGGKETSVSGVSPGRMGIDEVDDFMSAGQVELTLKRLESWGKKGRAYLASTVNERVNRTDHPVLDFHNRTDATGCRIAHRCPHCGWYQVIKFDQLNLDECRLACSHCGVLWTDDERAQALQDSKLCYREGIVDGKIMPCTRKTEYFTLLSTFADYNMGDFRSIPSMYRAAKEKESVGDYSLAKQFYMKVLCEAYDTPADGDTITDRYLTLRSTKATTPKGIVPDDVERIVVGVDVQGDRIYWVAVGSGSRDRRWIIDYGEWFWTPKDPETGRAVEPQDADRHEILDKILAKTRDGWPKQNGEIIRGSLVAIDIGYNPNGSIGRWIFGKVGVVAVRGDHEGRVVAETLQGKINASMGKFSSSLVSDHGFFEIRKQEHTPGQPSTWWFVKAQTMREHIYSMLRIEYDADNSLMLPCGIPEKDYLLQHLSSWAIVRDGDTKHTKWVQIRKRDDYFDATNYAIALLSQGRGSRSGGTVGKIKPKE
jgi:phage terminase large subunit GpA-like protein